MSKSSAKMMAEKFLETQQKNKKASWESSNTGVRERVNFDDTIWGFNLAGGVHYHTPLRVTYVKPNSRAKHAGIRAGDTLKRINDIQTETLTLQEAHDIIVESGILIRLTVTAPDDVGTTYGSFTDEQKEQEANRKREEARKNKKHTKPFTGAKTNDCYSLHWPWIRRRAIMYKESNCFLVPSKYEENHNDKLLKREEDSKMILMQPKIT